MSRLQRAPQRQLLGLHFLQTRLKPKNKTRTKRYLLLQDMIYRHKNMKLRISKQDTVGFHGKTLLDLNIYCLFWYLDLFSKTLNYHTYDMHSWKWVNFIRDIEILSTVWCIFYVIEMFAGLPSACGTCILQWIEIKSTMVLPVPDKSKQLMPRIQLLF